MLDWNLLDKILKGTKKVFLTTHVNPDADGLGSELGMYYFLTSLNIECKINFIFKYVKKRVFIKFI